jgi:small subunit ribosomal protein S4
LGDPKKRRKKQESPKKPWDPALFEYELRVVGEYGLKNRKELRTVHSKLRRIRDSARSTFALPERDRSVKTAEILFKVRKMGLIGEEDTIDDVLKLSIEDLLERRLQTMAYRKGLARSIHQARQLITHGHITLRGRVFRKPGKNLEVGDEDLIAINPHSPFAEKSHPIWV